MKQLYSTIPVLFKKLAAVFLLAGLVPFNGQAQTITLLSPNGGEAWNAGTYEEVSWVGDSLSSMLRLEFSPDGVIPGGTLPRSLPHRMAAFSRFPPFITVRMRC
ncbi:MAG: hypothetical protein IPH20_01545 [Bacteroidales bacterium]|nr:hypothetical protein [Bacteroidales bacterium]